MIIYFQLTFHPIQQIPEGTAFQIWSLAHLDPGREGPLFPIDRFHNRPLCSVRLRLQSKQVFRLAGTPKQRQQDMGSLILSSCQPLSLNSAASCFAVTESAVTGRRYQVVLESSINCDRAVQLHTVNYLSRMSKDLILRFDIIGTDANTKDQRKLATKALALKAEEQICEVQQRLRGKSCAIKSTGSQHNQMTSTQPDPLILRQDRRPRPDFEAGTGLRPMSFPSGRGWQAGSLASAWAHLCRLHGGGEH